MAVMITFLRYSQNEKQHLGTDSSTSFKSLAETKTKHNPIKARNIQLQYHRNSSASIRHTVLCYMYKYKCLLYI